jgi:hypothetical protein
MAAFVSQNVGTGGAVTVAAALACMVAYDGVTRPETLEVPQVIQL